MSLLNINDDFEYDKRLSGIIVFLLFCLTLNRGIIELIFMSQQRFPLLLKMLAFISFLYGSLVVIHRRRRLIVVFLCLLFLIFFSQLLLFPENEVYLRREICFFIMGCFPFFIYMSSIKEWSYFLDLWRKVLPLVTLHNIVYWSSVNIVDT